MCGRYTLGTPADMIAAHFDLETALDVPPRFNIAPSQEVPIVVARGDGSRLAGLARWGLESVARRGRPQRAFINARAETVAEKPAFRDSLERRRCLVPADGFYEWRRENGKQPYFFQLENGALCAFAGIWRKSDNGPPSFAILTTRPNELVAPIHQRMPAIVRPADYPLWLGRRPLSATELEQISHPLDAATMEAWRVDRLVNTPANDSPACRNPVGKT